MALTKGKGRGAAFGSGYGAIRNVAPQRQAMGRPMPYGGGQGLPGQKESAMCALHNKKRSTDCLEQDHVTGQFQCTHSNQCKQASANAGGGSGETAMCAIHNKQRHVEALELDDQGNYQCTEEMGCKVAGAAPQGGGPPAGFAKEGQGLCLVHNKARSWQNLREDGYGTFGCYQPNLCKAGAGDQRMMMRGPGPRGGGHFGGQGGHGMAMCAIHHKKRSMANLSQGFHGMECLPTSQCKVSDAADSDQAVCSMHGKTRSLSIMVEDGQGGYQCDDENECKGGAGPRGAGASSAACSVHGKSRSLSFLQEDGRGGYQCTAQAQCK